MVPLMVIFFVIHELHRTSQEMTIDLELKCGLEGFRAYPVKARSDVRDYFRLDKLIV